MCFRSRRPVFPAACATYRTRITLRSSTTAGPNKRFVFYTIFFLSFQLLPSSSTCSIRHVIIIIHDKSDTHNTLNRALSRRYLAILCLLESCFFFKRFPPRWGRPRRGRLLLVPVATGGGGGGGGRPVVRRCSTSVVQCASVTRRRSVHVRL